MLIANRYRVTYVWLPRFEKKSSDIELQHVLTAYFVVHARNSKKFKLPFFVAGI